MSWNAGSGTPSGADSADLTGEDQELEVAPARLKDATL